MLELINTNTNARKSILEFQITKFLWTEFYFELIYSKLGLIWTEFYLCQVTSEPVFSTLVFALNLHVIPPPRIKFVYLPPLDNFLGGGNDF